MQQKSVLMLMTEMTELYITDQKNFESLAFQGAFVNLDDFMAKTGMSIPQDKIRKAASEDDPAEQPYGIDISGSPIFSGIELNGERPIIAIRAKEDKWADSRLLLEKIIRSTP